MEFLSSPEFASQAAALGQVLLMDLVLAGDNAVAVGLAAAALPQEQRKKAILIGLAAAVVMRIGFALITVQLLALVGLLLAGGLLLLWVCWKMWRELREQATHDQAEADKELELAMSIEHGSGPSPEDQRKKAILIGLAAAVVMRIGFALITVQLLALVGLLLAGGLLLLWVCWKMWRELREQATHDQAEAEKELELAMSIEHGSGPSPEELGLKRKSFGAALLQIMVADITMSLDNVLAVAGAAHEHPWIMVFGLVLSIALMGVAATYIAKLLHRFSWIGYIGLVVVLYVALHMIWDGARQVVVRTGHMDEFNASAPAFLEIGPEEAAKHLGQKRTEDSPTPAPAEPTVAP